MTEEEKKRAEEEKAEAVSLEMARIREVDFVEFRMEGPKYITNILIKQLNFRFEGVLKDMGRKVEDANEGLVGDGDVEGFWNRMVYIMKYIPRSLNSSMAQFFPMIERFHELYIDGTIFAQEGAKIKFYMKENIIENEEGEEIDKWYFYFYVLEGDSPLEVLHNLTVPAQQTPQTQGQPSPVSLKPPGDDPMIM